MRDPQHDLAGHPRSPLSFEGLPAALQREHLADDGPQLSSVDSPGQLRQRRPVGLDDKEDPTCSRTPGLLGRLYDGDEHASWFEERPGAPPDLPAHQVEDHVYLSRPRSPRRYHMSARPPGQLNGKDADAASRAVDQHALAR